MGERGRQEDEYGRGAEEGASRSKLRGGAETGQYAGTNSTRQDELFMNKEIRQEFLSC